jgi:TadE-like protein
MRRRRDSERGATLVEMAIVLPVFLAMLFGIIEMGVAFYYRTLVDDAVQAGGRIGAAVGNGIDVDLNILETIGTEISKLPNNGVDTVKFVEIYRLNANGTPSSELNLYTYSYTADPTQCDWNPCPQGSSPINYSGWTWQPSERKVEVGNLDTIGVKIYFSYSWITGLFPLSDKPCTLALKNSTCWVEDTSQRLEPLQFAVGSG